MLLGYATGLCECYGVRGTDCAMGLPGARRPRAGHRSEPGTPPICYAICYAIFYAYHHTYLLRNMLHVSCGRGWGRTEVEDVVVLRSRILWY
eukprot:3462467-Rhodomonas_salina.7